MAGIPSRSAPLLPGGPEVPLFFLLLSLLVDPALAGSVLTADACSVAALDRAVDDARTAWTTLDLPGFQAQMGEVERTLSCLGEPIPPSGAAPLHEVQALAAWAQRDETRAETAFRGLLFSSPTYRPGPDIAPEGSGLQAAFLRAAGANLGSSDVLEGPLWVDGAQVYSIPTARAALVQAFPEGGSPRSWYLWGAPIPVEVITAASTASAMPGPERKTDHRGRGVFLALGAASAVGAVLSFRSAEAAYEGFWDSDTPGDARDLWERNRQANAVGAGLAVVASGCTLGAVLTMAW